MGRSGCPGRSSRSRRLAASPAALFCALGLICCRTGVPAETPSPDAPGGARRAAPAAPRPTTRPTARPAAAKDCGFAPRGKTRGRRAFFRYRLGCGVSKRSWREVVDINPAAMLLGKKRSVVWMVFTDRAGRRVLPLGRTVRYDFRFRTRRRGTIRLTRKQAKDGVFRLELPGNDFGKPCRNHLYIYFHNGRKRLDLWIDDWRYRC